MSVTPKTLATSLRREFDLPEDDRRALDAQGYEWEALVVGGVQWILIRDWPVPGGFSSRFVTAAVRIVPGYPAAALDMIYVSPPLKRNDGVAIAAVSEFLLDGATYQQWSRHYTAANPWRV